MKTKNAPGWDSERLEALAKEIYQFLVSHGMWIDTAIYYDGKCMKTDGTENGQHSYRYNGKPFYDDEADPRRFFEYVADPHILSMSFEGPLYDVLNYGDAKKEAEFQAIFDKHGIYYEMGHMWNLTCYEE